VKGVIVVRKFISKCCDWRPDRQLRTGFTLVESIAALVILTIAIPPMLFAVRQAQYHRVNPIMAAKARWLITEKLEDIIADRASTTRGYSYVISANYPAENPVSGYAGFTRSVAISETAADLSSSGAGYKRVTVTVDWTDATGIARSMAIGTIITVY
jgi:prepilin-type N-terminal cleavage/methylation domain-containing protein